jgi:hypothetical protein
MSAERPSSRNAVVNKALQVDRHIKWWPRCMRSVYGLHSGSNVMRRLSTVAEQDCSASRSRCALHIARVADYSIAQTHVVAPIACSSASDPFSTTRPALLPASMWMAALSSDVARPGT